MHAARRHRPFAGELRPSYIYDYQMYDYLDEAALARGHYVLERYPGAPPEATDALRSLFLSTS